MVIGFPLGKIIIIFHSNMDGKQMFDQNILFSYRDVKGSLLGYCFEVQQQG